MALALTLTARLLLAAVFLVAGAAKLRERTRFRDTLRAFGATVAAAPLAIALPLAEMITGAALLVDPAAFWAAGAALAFLLVFSAAVAYSLIRGRRPPCQCFGEISSEPIGVHTMARNAAFVGLAIVALLPGRGAAGPSLLAALDLPRVSPPLSSEATGAAGVVLAIFAGQAWLIGMLLSGQRRLSERVATLEARPVPILKGLPVGALAPAFIAPSIKGGSVTLRALLKPGKPVFLFFFDPDCSPCTALLPHIARWQTEHADRLRFVLLGRQAARKAGAPEFEAFTVLTQEDREVSELFKVPSIPSAQIINPDGRVQSHLAIGHEAINQLVANAVK